MITKSCPKKRSNLSVRVVEDETVVLDREEGLIHQFNQTASYIWDRFDGKSPLTAIANQLAQAFDVDPKTAAKDVAVLVSQLRRLNLLESS